MTIFENKLQYIYEKLFALASQFKKICAYRITDIPVQIDRIVIGQDKLKINTDQSVEYEINEDDLKYINRIPIQFFRDCSNLITVTIPDNVIEIVRGAFYKCINLTDMYLYSTIPPTLGSTDTIPTTTTIHVPIGSGDAYKNATNWSSFADKIVEDIEI